MKRTLLIMRHAKSSWADFSLADHDRPLNKRGKHDAPMMGKRLKDEGYECDLLLSSTANRALSTAKLVAKEMGYKHEIITDARLYMEDYLAVMAEVPKTVQHLMIVSHNPGSEDLVEYFTSQYFDKFPTAAYALIEIEGSWQKIETAKLLRFDYPKSLLS